MSTKIHSHNSGHHLASVPLKIPQAILSFSLPAELRDPVIGDLNEEFLQRSMLENSLVAPVYWYWVQATKSACVFIWQQRGTGMAYFFSVVFFIVMMMLSMATSQFGFWLISPPIFIGLFPLAFVMGIGATSMQACKLGLKASFSDASGHTDEELGLARKFLNVTGNQFLLVAGVIFFLGVIQLLVSFSQNPAMLDDPMRFARYGIALIPLFYGMIFKCLFYSAEQKVLWKYSAV